MVLIDKPPAPPPGTELNALQKASMFLQENEMLLIRIQATKDSYVERFGEEAYRKLGKDNPGDLSKELLQAGKLLLELISMLAGIQADRLSDLMEVLPPEESNND